MSKVIDTEVVKMTFDNSKFESNIKASLETIDHLKKSLKFEKTGEDLEKSIGKVNFNSIQNGLDAVTNKFSTFGTVADQAIRNITDRVMNLGEQMAKSITVDPILDGLHEYETQMGAVQTILSNTRSKGTTIDDVNAALDDLNTYADKTIYNFTQMTENIGRFTAAGVDLWDSTYAIKGISNLAAVSGSTAQQASSAMYQLSQALASGKVQLQDWNSVVNANMGGEVFQEALKRTSRVLGTGVDDAIEKFGTFRDSLTKSGWLTKEVLSETLKQISGAYTESDLLAQGYTQEQAKEIMELAKDAEKAATMVKTFTQLIDTLKEALGSGWTLTWRYIFGDFEQAREMWTAVSDVLGGMINKSSDARNAIVKDWNELGGRTVLLEAIKYAFEDILAIIWPIKEAFDDIFPPVTGQRLLDITNGFKSLMEYLIPTKNQMFLLKGVASGVFGVLKIAIDAVVFAFTSLTKTISFFYEKSGLKYIVYLFEVFIGLIGYAVGALAKFGDGSKQAYEAFYSLFETFPFLIPVALKVSSYFEKLKEQFEKIKAAAQPLIAAITSLANSALNFLINSFNKLAPVIGAVIGLIVKFGSAVASSFVGKAAIAFTALSNAMTDIANKAGGIFAKALEKITGSAFDMTSIIDSAKSGVENFGNVIGGGLGDVLVKIQNGFSKAGGFLASIFHFDNIDFSSIQTAVVGIIDDIKAKFDVLKTFIPTVFNNIKAAIMPIIESISKGLSNAFANFNAGKFGLSTVALTGVFGSIISYVNAIKTPLDDVGSFFKDLKETLGSEGLFGNLNKTVEKIKESFGALKGTFEEWQKNIQIHYIKAIASAIAILAASLVAMSMVNTARLGAAVAAMAYLFDSLNKVVQSIISFNHKSKEAVKSAGDTAVATKEQLEELNETEEVVSGLDEGQIESLKTVGTFLLKLSASMFILTKAIAALGKIDPFNLTVGIGGIIYMMKEMVEVANALKDIESENLEKSAKSLVVFGLAMRVLASAVAVIAKQNIVGMIGGTVAVIFLIKQMTKAIKELSTVDTSNLNGSMKGLLAFGVSLRIIASAVKAMGKIDAWQMVQGLIGVSVLLTGIGAFLKKSDPSKMGAKNGLGLLFLAVAMRQLCSAVEAMGSLDIITLVKGIVAVGSLMAAIGLMNRIAGQGGGNAFALRASILMVALAVRMLIDPIENLAAIKWTSLLKAVGAVTVLLIGLTAAMVGLGHVGPGAAVGALAMIVAAGAIAILAKALTVMAGAEGLGGTLLVLGGALVILALGLTAMIAALPGAAALAIAAVGIALLAPALALLGSLDLEQIGVAMLAIVGVIGAFGLAAMILAPAIPIILLFSVAMMGFGAAIAMFGGGLMTTAAGIATLTAAFGALAIVGPMSVDAVVETIQKLISGVAESLASAIPEVIQAFTNGFIGIMQSITDNADMIYNVITAIIPQILLALNDTMPTVFEHLSLFFDQLLTFLAGFIPQICETVLQMLAGIFQVIKDHAYEWSILGAEALIEFLKGLTESTAMIAAACNELIIQTMYSIGDQAKTYGPQLGEAGMYMIDGLIQGMILGIWAGMQQLWEDLKSAFASVIEGLKQFVVDFYNAGVNFIKGIIEGIASNIDGLINTVAGVAKSIIDTVASVLKIHSPSEEGKAQGENYDQGLANGISENSGVVTQAAEAVADSALETANEKLDAGFSALGKKAKEKGKDLLNSQKGIGEEGKKEARSWADGLLKDFASDSDDAKGISKKLGDALSGNAKDTQGNISDQLDKGNKKGKSAAGAASKTTKEFVASDAQLWKDLYRNRQGAIEGMEDDLTGLAKFEEDTLKKTEEIVKDYTENLESNAKKMANNGLFSKVSEKNEVTAEELGKNLQDQINQIDEYTNVMNSLNSRISSQGLKDAINEMGMDSLGELEALNSMTDDQLTQYTQLYDQKYSASLAQLKSKAQNQLSNLYGGVTIDMDQFAATFDGSLKSIEAYFGSDTTKVKMEQAGANITEGVAEGMKDDQALASIDKAGVDLANHTTTTALPEAFDSHSPSRETMPEGEFITQGIAEGMVDDKSKAAIREASEKLMQVVIDSFASVTIDNNTNISKFTEVISTTITNTLKDMSGNVKQFKIIGTNYGKNLIAGISSTEKNLKTTVTKLIESITKILKSKTNTFKMISTDYMKQLMAGFNASIMKVGTSTKKVTDKIIASLKIPNEKLNEIGKNYTKGLIEGIKSKSSELYKVIEKIMKEAIQTAKKTAKEKSPSKETFAIGKNLTAGLVNGISSMADAVNAASKDVSAEALDEMRQALYALSGLEDIDTTPVIAPVMDLSNIQNGVSEMNRMLAANSGFGIAANISGGMSARNMTRSAELASLRQAIDGVNSFNSYRSSELSKLSDAVDNLNAIMSQNTTPDYSGLQTAIDNLNSAIGNQTGNTSINNTFNIQSTNTKDITNEINRNLQKMIDRRSAVWA